LDYLLYAILKIEEHFSNNQSLWDKNYKDEEKAQKEKKMSRYQPIPLLEPRLPWSPRFYTLTSGHVGGGNGSVKPLDHETRNPASGVPSDWSFVEILMHYCH
jgi:hypothetical protein